MPTKKTTVKKKLAPHAVAQETVKVQPAKQAVSKMAPKKVVAKSPTVKQSVPPQQDVTQSPIVTPPVEIVTVAEIEATIRKAVCDAIAESIPSLAKALEEHQLAQVVANSMQIVATEPETASIPKQLPGYPPDPRTEHG